MRTTLTTANKKNLRVSTTIISLLSLAAILAVLSTISLPTAAYSGSTGAVFISDNAAAGNNVWVYARATDGSLTSLGSVSTHGLGTGTALASQGAVVLDGHWLLVVDAGSNEITVFKVSGATLTFASKASSFGTDPISITAHGNLVYALNAGAAGNIAGFKINSAGVLTHIKGSDEPLSGAASPSPEQIGFNNQGNVLVVTEKASNFIDTYTVSSSGVPSDPNVQTAAGLGPYGFAFNAQGKLLVSEAASNSVTSYSLSSNGNLRIISGAIPDFGLAPCWLVVNGNYAYAANAHGGTISSYQVSNTGGLSLFSSVAAHMTIPTLDMAFGGHFLYAHNGAVITGFYVFSDGSISSIASVSGIAASAAGLAAF
jgi:6-phosphogluconolactonase